MTQDTTTPVYASYDIIADWFDAHRSRELFEKSWLDKAIAQCPKNLQVLDLGCGMGEPIIAYLLKNGCHVTGVDGSSKLISIAKERYPEVEFIIDDMCHLSLKKKFDFILAWNSFFHLAQGDQRNMFKIFRQHLNNGGILMFTTGVEAGEVWSNNGGIDLYHASLSPYEYQELFAQNSFTLIAHTISDSACGGATVWLAKLETDEGI
jgi:SAM-dependent methyltransferase